MKVEPTELPVAQVAAQPRESPRITAAAAALPAGTARAPRFSTALTLIAFCIFLLGLLWSTVIVKLHAEHEAEIRDVMKDTANLARVFEEHTVRTFREADQTLQFIIDQYREHGNKIDLRRLAEDGSIINRIYTYISIIDEHGNLAAGSQPFKPMNLADREHFQVHVAQDTGRLFISKPLVGRASGKQSIQLSRRINKPDLSFGGVAVVSVDPAYFSRFYSALDLGSRGLVNVTGREDKIIRARRVGNDTTVGQDASKGELFKHLPASERGSYVSAGVMTGVSRILSYRALEDYPLVVLVGVATDEALTAFNQRSRNYYQIAALASLLILGFTAFLLLMVSRQEKTTSTLRLRNIELSNASEANARLAAIVESSNDAVVSRGLDRMILTWNAAAEQLFGYTAAEMIGRDTWRLIPPEFEAQAEARRATLDYSKLIPPYDSVRLTRDGRRIDVSVTQSPIKDAGGNLIGVALSFRDISERKRAEMTLRESEHRFRAIFDYAGVGITMRTADRNHHWTQVNDQFCQLLGYTREELLGLSTADITPLDELESAVKDNERLQRGEVANYVREKQVVRKDGRRIWVSLAVAALPDADGRPRDLIAVYQDITERKHAGQAQAQLAAIVESSNDAIISRTLDRKILTWNTAAERLFGWTAVEAIGQSVSLFIPPERADESNRNQTLVQADQPVPAYDTVRRTKDGRRIDVSLTHSPIKNERGETVSVALIFRDIGGRKRAEQAHAQLAAIVENSNDAIISRSPDGRFVSWNKGAERMFGYTAAEAIGQPITLILPPEERKDVARKVETTRRGETPDPYETRRVAKDGRVIDVVASVSPIRNAAGEVAAVSIIFHDITERKQAQEQIAFLSQYDTLTGLPNRILFRDRLELAIARAKRQRELVGIMLFNLDRFKQVNEGLGLEAGDELLRQVAARLKETLREVDTIARLGSDEFAILVEGMPTSADVTAVAEKLIEEFAIPFQVKGTEVVAVPSIGITIHPNGTDNSQVLLEHAEIAMERVKREGGGGYRLYDDEPATSRGGRFDLETRLRHALERGEFALHYQPKVRLLDGAITGAEALLRWNAPELGAINPAKFIPIAEESGLIVPIGEWVLRTACAQMQSWHGRGHVIGIAVNLSPRQFRQKNLVSSVAEVLKQSGLAPQHLELEITEGTAMTNAERAINILRELHGLGAKLSVDDFGTGYSSLAYLKRFPLDSLKIDRSFVVDVGADTNSEAIMRATIALAQSLKLKVVAEGVETEAQRDFLVSAGCDEMQGYLYSRPLPAADFLALLTRARQVPHGAKTVATGTPSDAR